MSEGEIGNGMLTQYQSGQRDQKHRNDQSSLSPNQSHISIPQNDSKFFNHQKGGNQINFIQKYQLPKIQKRAFDKSSRNAAADENSPKKFRAELQKSSSISPSPPSLLQPNIKNGSKRFVMNNAYSTQQQPQNTSSIIQSEQKQQQQAVYGEQLILASGGAYPEFKKNNNALKKKKKEIIQRKNRMSINPSSSQSKGTEQGFNSSTNLDATLKGLKKQIHSNGKRFSKSIRGGTQSATQHRSNDPYQTQHMPNASMILSSQNGSFQKIHKRMSRDSNAGQLQSTYKLPPLESRGNQTDSIKETFHRNNTTIESSQNGLPTGKIGGGGLDSIQKRRLKEDSGKQSKNSTPLQRLSSYQKPKKTFRTPIIDQDKADGNLSVTPLKLKYRSAADKKKANKSSRVFQQGKQFDSDSQQSFTYLSQYQQQQKTNDKLKQLQQQEQQQQQQMPIDGSFSPTKIGKQIKSNANSPIKQLRNMKRQFSQILERGQEFQARKSQASLKSTSIEQRKNSKNQQVGHQIEGLESTRIDRKTRPKRNPLSSKIFKSQQKKLQDQIDQKRKESADTPQQLYHQMLQQKAKVRIPVSSKSPYSKSQLNQLKLQQQQKQKSKYDSRGHRILQPTSSSNINKSKSKTFTSKTSEVNLKPWSQAQEDQIPLQNKSKKDQIRNQDSNQRHHSQQPKQPETSIRMDRNQSHVHDSLSPKTNNNFEQQSTDSRFNTHTFYMYKQRIQAVRSKQQLNNNNNNSSVGQNLSTAGLGMISGPELSNLQQGGVDSEIQEEINIPDQNNQPGKKALQLLKPPAGEFERKKLKLSTLRSSSPDIPEQEINDDTNQVNAQAMITGKNFGQSTFYEVERNNFERPYSPPFAGASPSPNFNSSQALKNKLLHKQRRLNRKVSPRSQFHSGGSLEQVIQRQQNEDVRGVYFESVPINKYNKSKLSSLQESQREPRIQSVSSDLLRKADQLLGVKFDYKNKCYIDEGTNEVYKLF